MKIYFNSIGIITNVSNIGDSLRQGSVGNVLEAHFEGVDNAYHSAKFNFTRSDGSKVNNVVMEWDNNNAEVFRFVFNDSWFFALAGTTTLTIYLYDTNGNVTTQGQHQFSIESTDYDEEPTITLNQYNEIMTAIAGKVATGNIIDNLESDASDKPLSARMGKALKQDVDAVAEELPDKIVKKHTYNGPIKFDESLNNLGFNSFEEIRNTDIVIWENPNLIDVGDDFTIYKGTYIFRKQSETSNDNLFVFSCLLTGFYTFSPIVGDKTVISLTLGTTISETLEAVATVSRNNATTIKYSNKDSGLKASRVQNAIDELADKTVKNTENVSNLNKETDSINGKIIDLKNALYGSILATEQQTYENVGVAQIDRANGYPVVDNQKAQVKGIKGKTLVVNQLIDLVANKTAKGLTITNNGDGSITISGTTTETGFISITKSVKTISGNKYNCLGFPQSTSDYVFNNASYFDIPSSGNGIVSATREENSSININIKTVGVELNLTFKPRLIDLTKAFGAGNEPTTIEEFNCLTMGFDFDTYNEGTIESTNITKIVVGGFNKLDINRTQGTLSGWENTTPRQFEEGKYYVGLTANNYYAPSYISNLEVKNETVSFSTSNSPYGVGFPVKVIGGQKYTLTFEITEQATISTRIGWYDKDGNYISSVSGAEQGKVAPDNAYWGVVCLRPISAQNIVITFSEICFHLTGNGSLNGVYKPYIPNIEVNLATVTLNGIGTAQDERTETETKTVIGSVDLGGLSCTISSAGGANERITLYDSSIGDMATVASNQIAIVLCADYTTASGDDVYLHRNDKTISGGKVVGVNGFFEIYDSALIGKTAEEVKNILSGKIAYYALANPVITNEGFGEIILEGVERGGTIATDSNADVTLTHVVYKPIQ